MNSRQRAILDRARALASNRDSTADMDERRVRGILEDPIRPLVERQVVHKVTERRPTHVQNLEGVDDDDPVGRNEIVAAIGEALAHERASMRRHVSAEFAKLNAELEALKRDITASKAELDRLRSLTVAQVTAERRLEARVN